VDLAHLRGSGPHETVTRTDVQRAVDGAIAAPARTRVSPAARRRASELGIDPSTLSPSAPDGALHLADVERAAAAVERTLATATDWADGC